ncbi:GerAB/ArcD/ProY family transporter [Dethiothermospora halolimnae]|uniref:GerAB/ArcD/ProY family transporter n=1 Tax=Dethiothermospora halolimnae TaxID=3114390 RepID=UPI003CCBE778
MNNNFSNQQIFFSLFGAIVGVGIVSIPKDAAEIGGTGGWISILIATVLSIIIVNLITYLGYIHEKETLDQYSELLIGKFFTKVIMAIYSVYFFFFFTFITRIAIEIIKLSILIETPLWALAMLLMGVIYYALTKGLSSILRFVQIYSYIIIVLGIGSYIIMFTQGKIINIRPLLGTSNIITYFKGSIKFIVAFLGIEIITFIPISRKNNKKILIHNSLMIFFIGIMYIVVAESCISVIGIEDIIHYNDSLIAAMRRVEVPYLQFLGRLDGIILTVWIMGIICTVIIFAYGSFHYTTKVLKNKNEKLVALIIVLLGFVLSQIPPTFGDVQQIIKYEGYLGGITMGLIPIILLIITKVKINDNKNK